MSDQPAQAAVATPIVINLGKQRRKRIKQLKQNRGILMDEVMEAVAQINGQLGVEAAGKVLVPVVLIYREKRKTPVFRF